MRYLTFFHGVTGSNPKSSKSFVRTKVPPYSVKTYQNAMGNNYSYPGSLLMYYLLDKH